MTEKKQDLDPHGYALEMAEKRRQWEQDRKAEAEQQESEQKQAELRAYLLRRGEEWTATTGERPTLDDLATWRREYMGNIEAEYQQEQQKKLQEAERLYGF